MSSKNYQRKDDLQDIRASLRRIELGQKRLERAQKKLVTWSNFHKGEHKSMARVASFVATLVSSSIIAAIEFFRK